MMVPASCNQVAVSSPPISRKNSFSNDSDHTAIDGGSNHSQSKKSKRRSSSHANQQQPTASIPFPWKLHRILDDADAQGFNDIISWVPSENGFKVHKTKEFDEEIMPKYFDKTKYKSFQRQLNMWGFDRVGSGPYKGAYLHDCFIRGQPKLCDSMQRTKIKGIHSKKLRKSILMSDPLGHGSTHSLGAGSSHSLGGSTHSLGLSRHSSTSSVRDVRASIEASAQKLADLERQKEEIQRKLKLVSSKANVAAVSDALNNMTSSSSSRRMVTPHTSLHSRSERDTLDEDFQPLPLNGGDTLLFGGRNFFFEGDDKNAVQTPQRRRAPRRFSLELKNQDSDEYVLRELPDFFGDEVGNGQDDSILSPTPLPQSFNVVTATSDINGNNNSSLVIGLDRPARRFSLLSTPVHNPFEKQHQAKPPRQQALARGRMNMQYLKNNLMMNNNMSMSMNMNIMKNNLMNMNINNNSYSSNMNNMC